MIIFYLCVNAEAYMNNLWQPFRHKTTAKNIHENL